MDPCTYDFAFYCSEPTDGAARPPCDPPRPSKPEKEIRTEIRAILKQIVGTNAYMPTLSGDRCVFDILAYTEGDAEVPADEWKDTHGHLIEEDKAQQVKLKSFDTKVHRIDAMVAYRYEGSI